MSQTETNRSSAVAGFDHALHGDEARALGVGRHENPFSVLGIHRTEGGAVIRTMRPGAERAEVIDTQGQVLGTLERGEVDGLFSGFIAGDVPTHRFRFTHGDVTWEEDDAYRFGTLLSDFDAYLLAEGRHYKLYEKLGAHPREMDGVKGVAFVDACIRSSKENGNWVKL